MPFSFDAPRQRRFSYPLPAQIPYPCDAAGLRAQAFDENLIITPF